MATTSKLLSILMFAAILKLFGCSGNTTKSNTTSKVDTLNDQISKSTEEFKNRPIHKKMTAQILDTTPDEVLLQTVFDNLIEKFPKNYKKEYQAVLGWTKSQQAIYIIWLLEAEVK